MNDQQEEPEPRHCEEIADATILTDATDICQQLLDRYGKSAAPQHRHLCATAAATRSIIQSESLPLTPLSYFAATIATLADTSKTLDSDAVSALSSFLAIVVTLLPEKSVTPGKATDAVSVLAEMVELPSLAMSTASLRALVKCLGVLVGFCDLEDWESVKLGFEMLLKFSIDKRPKVRRSAQDCLVKVFKSFKSPSIIKEASEVSILLKGYLPSLFKISASRAVNGAKDEIMSKPEHLEVLHMLNVLKIIVPYLFPEVSLKLFQQLLKVMQSEFSALTRHFFKIIEAILETCGAEVIFPEVENTIQSLASYLSSGRKNPTDTVISAATLLKSVIDIFYAGEGCKWSSSLFLGFGSIAGLLTFEDSCAAHASIILKDFINRHVKRSNCLPVDDQPIDYKVNCSLESSSIQSICSVFDRVITSSSGIPNEHILGVISVLFLKLGESAYVHMKGIIIKLADLMTLAYRNKLDAKHLQECIGSAITAIGPEKIISLLPISLNAKEFSCSNIWLLPILKNYVVGSSLGFYMEYFLPLVECFQMAYQKDKRTITGEDLQACAHGCWGLLPAFCRYPTDTCQNFKPLAKVMINSLSKDSFIVESITIALQELVNQNRLATGSRQGAGEFAKFPKNSEVKDSSVEFERKPSYSKKIASRNIRVLASCSMELLQALTHVFFYSPPDERTHIKDAIGCLASITDSSITKKIFISSLQRFRLTNDLGEYGKLESYTNASPDEEQGSAAEKDANRCLIMELASSLVEGASEDLIDLIFHFIKRILQGSDEIGQHEAYSILSRILEEHSWFCSSKFIELMDLLLGLKRPVDIRSLRSRFACFQILLVFTIKRNLDEENTKAFLILNEIILTVKDSNEEVRKAAYDLLLGVKSDLWNSSSATSEGPCLEFVGMITGYLSGSSPHIKSGAVSALSVLVYNDADICILMPDLVPSVLALLQTKAVEVIKAVLGFVKVYVSVLQSKDLQNFLSATVNGVLPWSSVSRHHFRSKVTVILEIMMRKCGSPTIESVTPKKYKGFVRSVMESRHGKPSSKETDATAAEPTVTEPPMRRLKKRKHEESGISPEENRLVEPRKRKLDKNHKGVTATTKTNGYGVKRMRKMRNSNHTAGGQPFGGSWNNKGNFNKVRSGGGNGKTEMGKKNKKAAPRAAAASKLSKYKKGRRHQKS